MTITEFKRLRSGDIIYFETIPFILTVELDRHYRVICFMCHTDSMGNNIQLCLKFPYKTIEFGFNGLTTENSDISLDKFLNQIILKKNHSTLEHPQIKPKQKENTMKTEFKTIEMKQFETYPMFMKTDAGDVVLFFKPGSGVVVSTKTEIHKVNSFSQYWDMNRFSPIENCSVTFSDKD